MARSLNPFKVKDSGEAEVFDTGAQRDQRQGKGRYDLLPPEAIVRLVQIYEYGATKYGERNWERGQPLSRCLDSALRHLFQYLGGMNDEDHLAQAAWNIFAMMFFEGQIAKGVLPSELDDLSRKDNGT